MGKNGSIWKEEGAGGVKDQGLQKFQPIEIGC